MQGYTAARVLMTSQAYTEQTKLAKQCLASTRQALTGKSGDSRGNGRTWRVHEYRSVAWLQPRRPGQERGDRLCHTVRARARDRVRHIAAGVQHAVHWPRRPRLRVAAQRVDYPIARRHAHRGLHGRCTCAQQRFGSDLCCRPEKTPLGTRFVHQPLTSERSAPRASQAQPLFLTESKCATLGRALLSSSTRQQYPAKQVASQVPNQVYRIKVDKQLSTACFITEGRAAPARSAVLTKNKHTWENAWQSANVHRAGQQLASQCWTALLALCFQAMAAIWQQLAAGHYWAHAVPQLRAAACGWAAMLQAP